MRPERIASAIPPHPQRTRTVPLSAALFRRCAMRTYVRARRQRIHEVLALANAGHTASAIAARTGIPRSTVRTWLRGDLPAVARRTRRASRSTRANCRPNTPICSGCTWVMATSLQAGAGSTGSGCFLDAKYPAIIDECTARDPGVSASEPGLVDPAAEQLHRLARSDHRDGLRLLEAAADAVSAARPRQEARAARSRSSPGSRGWSTPDQRLCCAASSTRTVGGR